MSVFLEFRENQLILHGMDYSKGAIVKVPCESPVVTQTLTNFADFKTIVSRFHGDELTISSNKKKLRISDGDSDLELNTQTNIHEYPRAIEHLDATVPAFTLDCESLVKAFQHCIHAGNGGTDSRYALSNMYIHGHKNYDNSIGIYCADGKRMAWTRVGINRSHVGDDFGLLVPLETARAIIDIFDGESGDMKIQASASTIWINSGSTEFCARLGEGRYPNVFKMICHKPEQTTKVNTDKLKAFLRQAAVLQFGDDTTVHGKSDGEILSLYLESSKGKANAKIPFQAKADFSIGLDYLAAAIQGSSDVSLGFTTEVAYIHKTIDDMEVHETVATRI